MHAHEPEGEQNIRLALILNVSFTVIELVGGLLTNSLAILSDALHDLGDSLVLGLALFAERKAKQGPDLKRTFGYARLSVFSALASGAILIGGSLFIVSEAIPRLFAPEAVSAPGMMLLAVLGISFNAFGYLRLRRGRGINEKVLSWHLFEDVLGWIAVLVGGALIFVFDAPIFDPILTIGFTLFILWGVFRSMREVANILLQGIPAEMDLEGLRRDLVKVDGVLDVHDLHVWSLDGRMNVLSAHVVVQPQSIDDAATLQHRLKDHLRRVHKIEHSTIELETPETCTGSEW